MSAPYPWLAQAWRQLLENRARPAQALLICGPAGTGKRQLALAWSQALLCETPAADGAACGGCVACHWFNAESHPDYRALRLQEKENKEGESKLAVHIDVEQARDTLDFVRLSSYRAGWRVVLVDPAEALNTAAANALLKVLEEPPLNTCFVLVSDQPRRLLPTIQSRCTRLTVGLPSRGDALAWLRAQPLDHAEDLLALSGGAPLLALEWARHDAEALRTALLQVLANPQRLDPVAQADSWKILDPRTWQTLAYKWLCDLLAARLSCAARFHPDFTPVLRHLGEQADLGRLLALAKVHAEQGRFVQHPLNRQLQLETWLIEYRHIFKEG